MTWSFWRQCLSKLWSRRCRDLFGLPRITSSLPVTWFLRTWRSTSWGGPEPSWWPGKDAAFVTWIYVEEAWSESPIGTHGGWLMNWQLETWWTMPWPKWTVLKKLWRLPRRSFKTVSTLWKSWSHQWTVWTSTRRSGRRWSHPTSSILAGAKFMWWWDWLATIWTLGCGPRSVAGIGWSPAKHANLCLMMTRSTMKISSNARSAFRKDKQGSCFFTKSGGVN